MAKRIFPRRNEVYTFKQIVNELDLRDSACLTFWENNLWQNIRDSHISEHDMLKLPHWAESRWKFVMETDEWIPIFRFAKDNEVSIDELVDTEAEIDPYAEKPGVLWVTPKGLPRAQYYRVVKPSLGDPYITTHHDDGDQYPLPVFDEHGKSEYYYFRVNNPGHCDKCKLRVEKRVPYRDPTEGNCRLYELCTTCRDRNVAADREEFANG